MIRSSRHSVYSAHLLGSCIWGDWRKTRLNLLLGDGEAGLKQHTPINLVSTGGIRITDVLLFGRLKDDFHIHLVISGADVRCIVTSDEEGPKEHFPDRNVAFVECA